MSKYRVVLSGIFYPVAILRYFENALNHRDDIELITVGTYTGTWIPWTAIGSPTAGMNLPQKYAKSPTIPLSLPPGSRTVPAGMMAARSDLQDIDLWIQCDAGFYFEGRLPAKKQVHIATDPHVLDYRRQRGQSDHFFNMQKFYSSPGDIYLPYAACEWSHYNVSHISSNPEYDVVMAGNPYNNRKSLAKRLSNMGIKVNLVHGLGADEYREASNNAKLIISYSSAADLIARVFEAGAMRKPLVTNFVPDLQDHFSPENDLYMFYSEDECVRQVVDALSNSDEATRRGENMFLKMYREGHFYSNRIDEILEVSLGK